MDKRLGQVNLMLVQAMAVPVVVFMLIKSIIAGQASIPKFHDKYRNDVLSLKSWDKLNHCICLTTDGSTSSFQSFTKGRFWTIIIRSIFFTG